MSRLVIGGPLVRAPLSITVQEACRLTDEGGNGWHFHADGDRIAEAENEEQLGSVSVAIARDDVLFVVGTRDAGTVAALRWLRHVRETHVPTSPGCWSMGAAVGDPLLPELACGRNAREWPEAAGAGRRLPPTWPSSSPD